MTAGNCNWSLKSWIINGFIIAVLALGLDMFFHHYCMMKLYTQYASLFRPMNMMMKLRWWAYGGYLVFGLFYVCIYGKGYEANKSNVWQGIRYGALMGIFYWGSQLLISVPFMPWPKRIFVGWFAIGMVEFIVLGFILGMLYKPKTA